MNYSVFSVSTPDLTPERAAPVLAELGYAGIEWRVTDQRPSADGQPGFWAGNRCTWPLTSFVEDAPRIKALTESAGLAMPGLGTYASCDDLDAVERSMRGAAILGVPQLRINVPSYDGATSYVALRDRALGQYRDVAALARQHGLRALIEIHHARLLPSASSAAIFAGHFDPADVGVIYDAGNMVYEGFEHYRLGLEVLGPYLALVHCKSARWRSFPPDSDGITRWEATWAPLRGGVVDFPALFAALRQVGYGGWISLEDFSTDQPLIDRLRDNLAYLRSVEANTV